MKVLGRGGLHFLQILSVWQIKPYTKIITHQEELSGTRVKYLNQEKRAYKHESLSYRISEIVSYNRSFLHVQRD